MPEVKATKEQLAAMDLRGGSLLVSAGAGSGKTWVLTQRLMGYVDPACKEEKAADITDFLVITFTRAAAGELKTRINEAVSRAAAELSARSDPDKKRLAHLRTQMALTGRAHISTIHSFCSDIIREFGTAAGIRTDFKVMEDERAEAIKASALNSVLERRYASPESYPGFTDLSDRLCRGRDDGLLSGMVMTLYDKLQSQTYPEVWTAAQKQILEREYTDFADSPWGKEILRQDRRMAAFLKRRMDRAVRELEEENDKTKEKYLESFSAVSAGLGQLCSAMDFENGGSWEKCRSAANIEFPRLKNLTNPDDPVFKDRMSAVWKSCKKACGEIGKDFTGDQAKMLADIRETVPALEALMDTVLAFGEEYQKEKQRNALMDYADLEHVAARLLIDENGTATETARTVAGRFTEIMVDEFQDVSRVQNAIFRAVSKEESNLFMVGDIKQSIYRFRLADPGIFRERYESFRDWRISGGPGPKRISLRDNFRSGARIIDAINSIFRSCMSIPLGDIDYSSPDQQLKTPDENAFEGERPELVLLQIPSAEDIPEDLGKAVDHEAKWVAGEIRRMLDGVILTGGGEKPPRRIEQSDIAILLRSYRSAEPAFRRELENCGIPVRSDAPADFMSEPETAFIVNMLSVTDNPHKDVPLLAVLRSPAFSFSPDELAAVRAAKRDADLYEALTEAAETDEKCRRFLASLKELRDLAPGLPVTELVWKIICDNDLIATASAMKDGMRRRDRLLSFIECAAEFEESGYMGLHAFTGWLGRRTGKAPDSGAGSGVTVMSVHKSKGLEFPVVFLCGTGKRFNAEDTKGRMLFDPELGLGAEIVDTERKKRRPTAAKTAIAGKIRRENLSEEMRLLYVALTRAKERLIITGTEKDADKFIENIQEGITGPVPDPELLASYDSQLKWLTAASIADGGATFDRRVIRLEAAPAGDSGNEVPTPPEPDSAEVERLERILRDSIGMEYPYPDDTALPSKITATELKRPETADEEAAALVQEYEDPAADFPLPDFGRKDRALSAAEKGTAVHLLLQHIDPDKTADAGAVREEIERLRREGFLSDRQAGSIDPAPVVRLFASDIGERMAAAARNGRLRREFRFSLLSDARDFFETDSKEQILLQGVADCFFEEEDGIVIVDYKTDRVFADSDILARSEYYRGQIGAYARALSRICGRNVKECVLFFLAPGKEIRLVPGE